MKKIYTILFIFFFSGCFSTQLLTQKDLEHIYTHPVPIDSLNIKTKFLEFLNEYFSSAKTVIQSNEGNLITGIYTVDINNTAEILGILNKKGMKIAFMFKCNNRQYKLKCVLKNIYMDTDNGRMTLIPTDDYKEKIKKEFDKFDWDSLNYIAKREDNF